MLSPWTLEDAADMVKELRPLLKDLGYFVTIGGGVLERGSSQNDLDLFLIPLRSGRIEKKPDAVVALLNKLWGYSRNVLDRDGEYFDPPPAPAPPRGRGLVEEPLDEDENDRDDGDENPVAANLKAADIYSHAMQFIRNGDDKIDVFIIGGK